MTYDEILPQLGNRIMVTVFIDKQVVHRSVINALLDLADHHVILYTDTRIATLLYLITPSDYTLFSDFTSHSSLVYQIQS